MKIVVLAALMVLIVAGIWIVMIRMPGENPHGELPAPSPSELLLRDSLGQHVNKLAGEIGERNVAHYDALRNAENYIDGSLVKAGYQVRRQEFEVVPDAGAARACANLEVEIPGAGRPGEIVVVAAHYDSAPGTAGANDNASGTAALLERARAWAGKGGMRTLRFVFFTNEEPPYFKSPFMGSLVYAQRSRARDENIVAMLSLETIGYYSDAPGSQPYPFPIGLFYPTTGNFLGFVGNVTSRPLVHQAIQAFRASAKLPSSGVAAPAFIRGVDWSDHWSFWKQGYRGLMVTDTAVFRYPYYHTAQDTPDKIDYQRLARAVAGLDRVIERLVTDE